MPARTKRRAKFDFRGRPFAWWVDGYRLRVCSLDKKFVVALSMDGADVEVIGPEFPGLDGPARPVCLPAPRWTADTLGGRVDEVLRWAFSRPGSASRSLQ